MVECVTICRKEEGRRPIVWGSGLSKTNIQICQKRQRTHIILSLSMNRASIIYISSFFPSKTLGFSSEYRKFHRKITDCNGILSVVTTFDTKNVIVTTKKSGSICGNHQIKQRNSRNGSCAAMMGLVIVLVSQHYQF